MSAPMHRSVCQLTGQVARPSKFFQANAAADERLDELEALRAENTDLKRQLADARELLDAANDRTRQWVARADSAAAQRDRARVDRDTAAAALSAAGGVR